MEKETKPKKATTKEVIEETKVELPVEPIVETPVEEPKLGDVPPSVTLEEVKEVVHESIIEEKVEPIVEKVVAPEPIKETVVAEELPMDKKILDYLETKSGEVRLNDFLKSLFPLPKFGEPPVWNLQGSSKTLRGLLEGMVASNSIAIVDNKHRLLGQPYYPDTTTGKQHHHNLNTVVVTAKK